MSVGWLIIGLVVVALVALWVRLTPLPFKLRGDRPTPLRVTTDDGWTLTVWYRPARQRRFVEPIVLCHGLANNHALMEFLPPSNLAAFLSEAGFDCYSVDLRGAGGSHPPLDWGPWDATVDDHITHDAPAVIDFVRAHARADRVVWLGHSLGGMIGLAAATTSADGKIAALVTIGSPVFFRYRYRVHWAVTIAKWLAPAGRFPMNWFAEAGTVLGGRFKVKLAHASANLDNLEPGAVRVLLANVFAPIWRGVLLQFEEWIRDDVFRSLEGVDYRSRVRNLTVPVLVCGGTVDFLAPPRAQRAYFEHLTTPDRTLVIFGKKHGQTADYGHGDLLVGRDVSTEVYPVLRDWLVVRARPYPEVASLALDAEGRRLSDS